MRANSLLRSALSIADRQGAQTNWKAFRDRIAEELGLQHPITGPLWATTDMPTPDYMTNPPSSDGLQEIARELLRLYDWRNEVGAAITDEQARKYGREKKAAWTRLREVLSTSAPEGEDARFKVGDVVRYDDGQTALFRIDSISEKHDGRHDRFYGEQCMGGSVGAYSSECRPASGEDLKTWAANLGWREAARASEESKS